MSDTVGQLMAGTTAGMMSVLVDYPLDTLKTRMQVGGARAPCRFDPMASRRGHGWRGATAPAGAGGYMGCLRDTWSNGGVRGFYRGITVPLLAQGSENAIIFSVFAATERRLRPFFESRRAASGSSSPAPAPYRRGELWCAAAAAGAAVSVVLTPVEFVKGNMQMCRQPGCTRGVLAFCRHVLEHRGAGGFYAGFTGTLIRAVSGNTVYFLTYRQLLHTLGGTGTAGETPAAWLCILAGGLSGCAYWTVAYPCDVAKTRMQVCESLGRPYASALEGRRWASHAPRDPFPNTLRGALARTYRQGGVRALYRGWCITAVRAFVSSATVFTVYEQAQRQLQGMAAVGPQTKVSISPRLERDPTPAVGCSCARMPSAYVALENPFFA